MTCDKSPMSDPYGSITVCIFTKRAAMICLDVCMNFTEQVIFSVFIVVTHNYRHGRYYLFIAVKMIKVKPIECKTWRETGQVSLFFFSSSLDLHSTMLTFSLCSQHCFNFTYRLSVLQHGIIASTEGSSKKHRIV